MVENKGCVIFLLIGLLASLPGSYPLLGQGEVSFQDARRDFAAGPSPSSVAAGDFNGDKVQDLVVANEASNSVSILLGTGDGTFASGQRLVVDGSPDSVAVGDFDGDHYVDLAVAVKSSNMVAILLGNGDGTFGPARSFATVGLTPRSVTVGDFDGDGLPDLAVANGRSNTISVLLNTTELLHSLWREFHTPQ